MSNIRSEPGIAPVIKLPAVLDLTTAEALKAMLLAASASPDIEIDAGAVQRITSPCLQVFAALAKDTAEAGGGLRFTNVPDAFRETANLIGLSGLLGLGEI
jgi:chemotaxis protein CheX